MLRPIVLSRRDIEELYPALKTQHDFISKKSDPETQMANKLIEGLEVLVGSAGVGFLAGRLGTTSIGQSGIPLGLVLGVGAHAINYFGLAGKYGDHLSNLGNGAIAGFGALWAAGQGSQMRLKAGQPAGPIVAGNPVKYAPPQMSGYNPPLMNAAPVQQSVRPLTEAELQLLAQQAYRRTG